MAIGPLLQASPSPSEQIELPAPLRRERIHYGWGRKFLIARALGRSARLPTGTIHRGCPLRSGVAAALQETPVRCQRALAMKCMRLAPALLQLENRERVPL